VKAELARRIAITVAGPALVLAATRIRLPGVSAQTELPPEVISIVAMGILPFLSAALLVEVAAALIPPWRRLRHGGPAGRAKLTLAMFALGFVLAAGQAWGISRYLESYGFQERAIMHPGHATELLIVATLTAGSFALAILAQLISRYGLGNGFSVLLAGGLLTSLVTDTAHLGSAMVEPLGLSILVGAQVVIAGLTVAMVLPRQLRPHVLRGPTAGLVPLEMVPFLVYCTVHLGFLGLDVGPLSRLFEKLPRGFVAQGLIVATSGILFSLAFNRPSVLRRLWGTPDVRAPLIAATRAGVLYVLALMAVGVVVARVRPMGFFAEVAGTAVLTAIAVDLWAEGRTLLRHGQMVPVWPLHRLPDVDLALLTLSEAGIPAHPRAAAHRSLLQFFGPLFPVEILVPSHLASEGRTLLHRALGVQPHQPAGQDRGGDQQDRHP
jgi:hypothetical protein